MVAMPIFLSRTSLGFPLGFLLQEAGLITDSQVRVALMDQVQYCDLKIGEILALRGWITQETADFFAEKLPTFCKENTKHQLGFYLNEANLLTHEQIKNILIEQNRTMVRFGTLAVLKGYLKQETLDFFIRYLFPEHRLDSPWIDKYCPYSGSISFLSDRFRNKSEKLKFPNMIGETINK
jgi:hypothetical protein